MLNNMDPVAKQLWIFSFIVSVIICSLINFILVEFFKGSFLYGFPIGLAATSGIGSFLVRLIDSFILGLVLTPMMYYIIKYLQTRVRF